MIDWQFVIGLQDLSDSRYSKIKDRITDRIIEESSLYRNAESVKDDLPRNSYIEVIGAWEDGCIVRTIYYALKAGTSVRVPKGLTVKMDENSNNINENLKADCVNDVAYKYRSNGGYHFFYPKLAMQ